MKAPRAPSWRKFENGKLGGPVAQPAEAPFLRDEKQVPETASISSTPRAWQVRTPGGEIRASEYDDPGLFRVARGTSAGQDKGRQLSKSHGDPGR